ncbi:ROK family transcriptional regulator [Tessaracoccus sp. Z1128]
MNRVVGAPGSQPSLREANSARIVEAVKAYGRITQVELASATGLSPATVSNIVKQLLEQDVVVTSATTRSGRRAQLVALKPSSALAVGMHIDRRSLVLVIADATLEVLASKRLPLPMDHRSDTTLDRAAMLVADLADEVGASMDHIGGLGLALPSSVGRGGRAGAFQLPGWEELDVDRLLSARIQRPVLVVKEADAGALAESRLGALRGVQSALYVHASHTTESSFLLGGVVHQGFRGGAGALGHVRVDPAGQICRCGARGCLNTVVSGEALAELVRLSHGAMDLRAIVKAVRDGDPGCRQVVADAGSLIGTALADLATVIAPERITWGGDLATVGEPFVVPLRDAVRGRPLLPSVDELLADPAFPVDGCARGALVAIHDLINASPAGSMEG